MAANRPVLVQHWALTSFVLFCGIYEENGLAWEFVLGAVCGGAVYGQYRGNLALFLLD